MADVAVVTDRTCYLPAALIDGLDITMVESYFDLGAGPLHESEFDGDLQRFFAELDASKTIAPTSSPTVEDYLVVFERLLSQHSAVVAILQSSGISTACSNARQAVARLEPGIRADERVAVVDSAGAVGIQGVQALAAARAAAAGEDAPGVIAAARRARQGARGWLLLDTLEYLRRGGRIGGAAAWFGSVLDLKPILTIESETKAVERVRTRRRGIERLTDLMQRHRAAAGADRWFVQYAGAHQDARQLVDHLGGLFGTEPEFACEVGPIFATNVGPGALMAGCMPGTALYAQHD